MHIALNNKKERISAENADKGLDYFCPCCGQKLILKKGKIKTPHFAHTAFQCDSWYSDNKGEWHRKMQAMFPEKYQEVKLVDPNDPTNFHIADICLPMGDTKLVFEFQHSPMSVSEFHERNQFYVYTTGKMVGEKLKPNKIIWVFDYTNREMFFEVPGKHEMPIYESEVAEKTVSDLRCEWHHSAKTLSKIKLPNKNITILLHVTYRTWENRIAYFQSMRKTSKYFISDFLNDEKFKPFSMFVKASKFWHDCKFFEGKCFLEDNYRKTIEGKIAKAT